MKPVSEDEAYDELRFHTLSRGDPEFVHQYVVDCWTLQHADAATKPMAIAFALITLCMHLERGASGRDAQRLHIKLARKRREWPRFPIPRDKGDVTVRDVIARPEGKERDAAIDRWCASLWSAYEDAQPGVRAILHEELRER